jgi:uncharacterized protein (TIGR03578 family)
MSETNIMKSTIKDIVIEATGKSMEEAYGDVFRTLRKKVYSEIKGLILHMEPTAVYVLKEEIKEYTEKFLFIFMPRQKKDYKLTVKVTVDIRYIET